MSGSSEVLTPILLRSSTPAPSEKVLLYLEGIARSGGASPVRDSTISDSGPSTESSHHKLYPNDPHFSKLNSLAHPQAHRLSSLSQSYHVGDNDLDELNNSAMSFEKIEREEISSNIQEGLRSQVARSERSSPRHEYQEREPGPEDGPGPKYESFGSSFGNLGPPRESFFGPPSNPPAWMADGTPSRAANVALPPESEWMSPRTQAKSAPWGQHMLKPTSKAAMMSPREADYNINVEPPSDPSRYSSKAPSRAPSQSPSQHSRRSSGTTKHSEVPPPAQAQQHGGITVSIGPDGSTTISIPRATSSKTPPEKAPTEKAHTEYADDARSKARSRVGSERPTASVAGSRRLDVDAEDRASLVSPEIQARSLKSPSKSGQRAASKAPSRASQMSPLDAYRPLNEFQPFSAPLPPDYGAPPQKAPSMKAASSRAPSQRPAASQRAPSELGTIPNEFTGDGGYHRAERPRKGSVYGNGSEVSGYGVDEQTNGYTNGRPSGANSASGYTLQQRTPMLNSHSRMTSLEARAGRMRALSPVPSQPNTLRTNADDSLITPTQSRPASPEELNDYETEIVQGVLSARTPRTSIAPSLLAEELKRTQYHDEDLCILLHAADSDMHHEIVRKALRKAVAARIKKLGLKNDRESIKQYRKKFHDHDPSWHATHGPSYDPNDPPAWAKEMMEQLLSMEDRVAALGPQLESLKKSDSSRTRTHSHSYHGHRQPMTETQDDYDRTPRTQTIPIGTQMTGTMADESMYRHPETEYTVPGESMGPATIPGSMHHHDGSARDLAATDRDEFEDEETQGPNMHAYTDRTTLDGDYLAHKRGDLFSLSGRGDSPGQQVLEEELYRLRVKEQSRSAAMTHQSWVLAEESVGGDQEPRADSEIPDIDEEHPPDSSPPLPPIPDSQVVVETQSQSHGGQVWQQSEYHEHPPTPPWQRIHQRLLNWAIVWPMTELDSALNSTLRGNQVDEVSLSIWSTQMYKRYVRQQLTEVPPGRVDRLFVPPNMADAINNAVFHGRHGDACGMLRDLWTPFGLEGMPRIIVVLCKHRSDPNHWVAHKFSLPDGTLTTYDTYPEKCLPDGRPLGWWFAIRIAWPGAMYPSPDHLMQKMVRLHRPMQLDIDNSVAAAGIWRNLLMGSRAERPVDLERLRDLINTEVKNLRQRKEQGKLSVAAAIRQNWNWDDMAA
ncbi:hypothetical protein EW145_g1763 [Phellinidium pouzarii]|uniref:Uncharacterized protein n=1 Tax=Phellinidium pouzarii TaxID=167371 RepID=A0A4S4LDT0_9AGAM|nr:hypothetical protein EW145_g1763 [Phellinidium pouzarii]